MMDAANDPRQLRRFGLLVGGIFLTIGLWPAILRGESPRLWAVVLGIGLVLPALVAPGSLRPIHRMWMVLANALGWVNTRVVLGAIFFGLITPVGLIRRVLHHDPLGRGFKADVETYRVPQHPRSRTHLTHQF
jgi:hypothetical protein